MKIVTYNVNGLRVRMSQFGSLVKLLQSLDADIICFQETKLSKQELRTDVVWAEGYESFFSCTRTSQVGRTAYSGVATFCRVKSAFSSNEVALPLDAEEGFTGTLGGSQGFANTQDEIPTLVDGLEEFDIDELHKVDSEGRCIITDHGHFVLFNIYGPRADSDDTERVQFKLTFYKILQRRWESLLRQGRRVFVVGDLNIAPTTMDFWDAGKDFENNEFRRWFRSMLVESGGPLFDVFRAKHPERREAYTCFATDTGAEVFDCGSRIDHILSAGSCLHPDHSLEGHDFVTCHVKECDILTQFKRWKPGNSSLRWKERSSIKLEGSDHIPVYMSLLEIPSISEHNTPSLSTRYCTQVQGRQQTLVSMLMRRQSTEQVKTCGDSSSFSEENITIQGSQSSNISSSTRILSALSSDDIFASSTPLQEGNGTRTDECSQGSLNKLSYDNSCAKSRPRVETKKKAKQSQSCQLSLRSFFQKSPNNSDGVRSSITDISISQSNITQPVQDQDVLEACDSSEKKKSSVALQEWQRIQLLMQNSVPLCKGHKEPCVARVSKKSGPNLGRRFHVCARAEGPAANPEANCGYFKWVNLGSKRKQGQ